MKKTFLVGMALLLSLLTTNIMSVAAYATTDELDSTNNTLSTESLEPEAVPTAPADDSAGEVKSSIPQSLLTDTFLQTTALPMAAPTCIDASEAFYRHSLNPATGTATVWLDEDWLTQNNKVICGGTQTFALVSYKAQSAGSFNASLPQTKYNADTDDITLLKRSNTLSVQIPPCYHQLDLVWGDSPLYDTFTSADSNDRYGNRILGSSDLPGSHSSGGRAALRAGNTSCDTPQLPCVDGYEATVDLSDMELVWLDRFTVQVNTLGHRPLCEDVTMWLSSYLIPDTWDGNGFNSTALPQTKLDSDSFLMKAGTDGSTILHVATPPSCEHYQLDIYYGDEITGFGYPDGQALPEGRTGSYALWGDMFWRASECEPAQPTAQVIVEPCVIGVTGRDVAIKVTNTDDLSDADATYDVTFNGTAQSITLADGTSGTLTFANTPAGNYTVTFMTSDGTTLEDIAVTVGEDCQPPATDLCPLVAGTQTTTELCPPGQGGGQVASTTRVLGAATPAQIPATGSGNLLGLLITLFASALTYTILLGRQKKHYSTATSS